MPPRFALVLLAAGAVVLAASLATMDGGPSAPEPDRLAFADLAPRAVSATRIEITGDAGRVLLLQTGGQWVLPDQAGYPADQGRVRALLLGLSELVLREERTSQPADYARLGVADPSASVGGGTLVRVMDGSGLTLAAVIIGHARPAGEREGMAFYVRRPDQAQAWLAAGTVEARPNLAFWRDNAILDIDQARIVEITAERGGSALTLARQGETLVMRTPAEHGPLDRYKVDDAGRALQNLTFEDVRRGPAPGSSYGRARFRTLDGLMITLDLSRDTDGGIWAQVSASGDADARNAADAVNVRTNGWAYRLDSGKAQELAPTLADLEAYQPATSAAATAPAPAGKPPTAQTQKPARK